MARTFSIVLEHSLNVVLIFRWFISNFFDSFETPSTTEFFLLWFLVIRNLLYLISQKKWRTSSFTTAIRGFHYHRKFWKQIENEKLKFLFEDNNPYDRYVIKTVASNEQTTSHLSIEILKVTTFFRDRRAVMLVEFTLKQYYCLLQDQGEM